MKFSQFSEFPWSLKVLSLNSFGNTCGNSYIRYSSVIIAYRFTCGEKKIKKHQKVSKYFKSYCPEDFVLLFIFLLTAKVVKTSHIYASISSLFLKIVLEQTWNCFNTKLQLQWKDRKSSYEVWQVLGPFLPLNFSKFSLK